MWPTSYAKRVASDLESWVEKGWVSADNAPNILASLNKEDAPSKLPVVITVLGAVLIGFSAMAFVAANWADMSKGLRLGILGLAMWSAYGAAAFLHMRNQVAFTEAAFVVGVALFGANIMLIGQMYHLPQDFPAGLLAWSLGGLVTAWVVQSRAALAATQLLLMGWTMAVISEGDIHLMYLLPWAVAALLAFRLDWGPAKHLALIGLIVWLLGNSPNLAENLGWGPIELLAVLSSLFGLIWLAGIAGEERQQPFARALQGYAAITLLVMFWVGHVVDEGFEDGAGYLIPALSVVALLAASVFAFARASIFAPQDIIALATFPVGILLSGALTTSDGDVPLILTAPLLLALCVWLVTLGTRLHNRFLINLGFAAFGGEALYLYLETFGTLLDTAAFFAIGGILLIAGGFVWERLRRRATATQSEATS